MPNVSSFGAQTDNAVVQGTVTDRQMIIPDVPPQGLMSVGPRVSFNFLKLWDENTDYHYYDVVQNGAGASYIAIKPFIPAGTELMDGEFWRLWSEPNAQISDLREIVELYDKRITQNTNDIATKAPTNHASEETIYGIGNEINYGHVKLATDDTPMTNDANAGVAVTPSYMSENIKKREYFIKDYGTNFNEAFNKIMQAITDGGTIVIPAEVTIEGDCTINKNNVSIIGGGTFNGTLIVNTPIQESDAPSNSSGVIIQGMKFRGAIGIDIKHAPGLKIESCDFYNENVCINCTENARASQYNAQMIINANTLRSNGFGVYFKEAEISQYYYHTSDTIISNNVLNNKISNIHIVNSDGVNIVSNIMFLSLGGTEKKHHVYLEKATFNIISNNEMFESGEEAIKINNANQTSIVSTNNIIWAAQVKRVPAINIKVSKTDTYFNISNNTIERASSTAIELNSEQPKISNNYIILPGDTSHIIAGEEDVNSYGINLPNTRNAYVFGNVVTGAKHNNMPKMNKGLNLGIINSTQVESNHFYTRMLRRNISTSTQILNVENEIPCYFMQTSLNITKKEFIANTTADTSFVTGFVICFGNTSLTIDGNVVVSSNKIRQFVIVNGEITWFTETTIASK